MKIVISKNTTKKVIEANNQAVYELVKDVKPAAAGAILMMDVDGEIAKVEKNMADFANISFKQEGNDLTFEVSDEILIKSALIGLKIAKAIAPFVKGMINLIQMAKIEYSELGDMIARRK